MNKRTNQTDKQTVNKSNGQIKRINDLVKQRQNKVDNPLFDIHYI